YAPALNIYRFNRAAIVHHDPSYTDHMHVLEPVEFWTALAGSAQVISNGVKTLPAYSGAPGGLNPIFYSDDDSWYRHYLRARAAIGLSADNQTLVLFTVDEVYGSS